MSDSDQTYDLLAKINIIPHTHQKQGMEWCVERHQIGGIIADEMGLGKTLLALMGILRNPVHKTLIIVPLALLEQWVEAVQMIIRHEPFVFHSSRAGHMKFDKADLEEENSNVFISTYNIMLRQGVLHKIEWDRVIYDEAHILRNAKTKGFKAAASLASGEQWFLTGTPIQNQTADIASLLQLLHNPITSTDEDLKAQIGQCMLRRTKASVGMALPTLTVTDIDVAWESAEEQRLATGIHSSLSFSNVDLDEKDSKPYQKISAHYPLVLMTRAKQACTSSALLKPFMAATFDPKEQAQHKVLTSSKFNALIAHVKGRLSNHKRKVIFTNFRDELDNIMQALRTPEVTVAAIDGRTTASERRVILSETYDVLIMQINTGSVGLNLQKYSEVYIVGPGWNPATEQQAIARCHRQGQTEEVNVFRLVMSSFTEADLKQKKRQEEETAREAAAVFARDAALAAMSPEDRTAFEAAEQEAQAAKPVPRKKLKTQDSRTSTIDMYARSKQLIKLEIADEFIGGATPGALPPYPRGQRPLTPADPLE